jgi:alpha-1,6-mannosyltransferase
MAATPAAPRMRLPRPPARAGALPSLWIRALPAALGIAALGVVVGLCGAIGLAAAERPSRLSGPAEHGFPSWMVGPLAHRLPGLTRHTAALQADFTIALVVLAVAWLVATLCAPRLPAAVVWTAVAASQLLLVLGPPLSLTDVFNYLHYGRMAALYGLNPYHALPVSAAFDPAYRFSNWHHLPSPYGPLFTLLSEGLAPLGLAASYWTWKAIVLASSLGTLATVAWAARRVGRSPQAAVALVGLNPLVLVYGIGGLHNEPLMLLAVVGAVALVMRGRDASSPAWDAAAGVCAALAAGIKPSAALVVALVVLGARRRLWALAGAAVAGLAIGAVVELVYGGWLPAVGLQAGLVTPLSVPNVLAALLGRGALDAAGRRLAELVFVAIAAATLAAVAWRRWRLVGAAGIAMLGSVLTLGWTMPWYVWWVLPFAALLRTRALAVACVALTLWLGLGAIPQSQALMHAAGYRPTRTPAGRADHLYLERLLS